MTEVFQKFDNFAKDERTPGIFIKTMTSNSNI